MRVWRWQVSIQGAELAGDRFLSVRLGPHHKSPTLDENGSPDSLVLEFESNQWVLYLLDGSGKVIQCIFPGPLESAYRLAQQSYGVAPAEWIEDSDD